MSEPITSVDALSAAPVQPSSTRHIVEFTGDAAEFFRIWIVNILLSIVTLGIYSAWAKVRTNQYLYSHTKIAGHAFRYLANPIQILKGRLIAVAIFALIAVLNHFNPLVSLGVSLLMLFAFPWLLLQSLRFKMRMTSYRNVRFGFHGSYGGFLKYFIGLPVLSVFTMYLLMPYALKRMDEYVYNNVSYGGRRSTLSLEAGTYYSTAFKIIGMSFAIVIAMVIAVMITAVVGSMMGEIASQVLSFIVAGAFYIGLAVISRAMWTCVIRNYTYNNLKVEQLATFESNMEVISYSKLLFTNTLLVAFTLGLAYPWALIRLQQYRASCTTVLLSEEIERLTDPLQQDSSAFAEEASDLYDVDFALT
ncbi:MAG TPA: DUF898 domain-containing protein [Rheinheimera sp.]|nr:DUF898 domain-containing protein [Rheinheimera sp.]